MKTMTFRSGLLAAAAVAAFTVVGMVTSFGENNSEKKESLQKISCILDRC